MAQPHPPRAAAFGLNVDPNTGGLAIAARITAIADANGLEFVFWPSGDRERQSRVFAEEVVPAVREALNQGSRPSGALGLGKV